MRHILITLFVLLASISFGQTDTIPQSQSQPFFDRLDARHFTSWDQQDTLAIYQPGDTAHIMANDSIYIHQLMGYHINAGQYGDTVQYEIIGNDSIYVHSCTFRVYDNPDYSGTLKNMVAPGDTFALKDSSIQYIGAFYNNGDPELRWSTGREGLNVSDGVPVLTIFKQNGITFTQNWTIGDGLVERLFKKDIFLDRYERASGLVIDTLNDLNVQVSSGTFYQGGRAFDLNYFNSVTDSMYFYFYDGAEWDFDRSETIPNQQYNPPTGLANLGNNRYTSVWVFRATLLPDDHVPSAFYVLDDNQYNKLSDAVADVFLPPQLPAVIRQFSIFVGRFIIEEDGSQVDAIETAFGAVTPSLSGSSGVSDHGDLTGLDDPADHPWALEWSDTTSDIATKYDLDSRWNKTGNYVYNLNDSIGIGTSTPNEKLDVSGNINMTGEQFDISNTYPKIRMHETDASTNNGVWKMEANNEIFSLKLYTDDETSDNEVFDVYTISGIIDFTNFSGEIRQNNQPVATETWSTLQNVTEQGNTTDNVISIQGTNNNPGSGEGIWMQYSPTDGQGRIYPYDYGGTGYKKLRLDGDPITLEKGNVNITDGNLQVDGTGDSYFAGPINTDYLIVGDAPLYPSEGAVEWSGSDFRGYNGSSWVSLTSGSGVTNFTDLGDTPSSITADKWLKANSTGDAIIWTDSPSGTGTDDQILSIDSTNRVFDISIENGNIISFKDTYQDGDTDPTNEYNTILSLSGTTLSLTDGGGTLEQDLSSLQDGTGTDNQNLTWNDPNLLIENGNSVDLSSLQDGTGTDNQNLLTDGTSGDVDIENGTGVTINVDDADASIGNEYQDLSNSVSGTDVTVEITNGDNATFSIADNDNNSSNEIQDISTNTNPGNISISSGSELNLNVDDADANIGNEYNTGVNWDNTNNDIEITDGGGTKSATVTGFLESESDPVYSSDPASGISSGDITDWDDAYSQRGSVIDGDNLNWDGSKLDVQGVVTSESDPVYSADPAYNISSTDVSNWDNAYSHSTTTSGNPHNIGLSDVSSNDNATADDLYANDFVLNSDRRLKKDIRALKNPMQALQLNPVQFKWRESGKLDAGFVAQDLMERYPYLVKERPDGYLGISYAKITALNNATIQELWKQLKNQGQTIKAQQKRINKLSNKVQEMEQWLEENTSY